MFVMERLEWSEQIQWSGQYRFKEMGEEIESTYHQHVTLDP
jgi:hypothetical protein